jgi:hypothetical protein
MAKKGKTLKGFGTLPPAGSEAEEAADGGPTDPFGYEDEDTDVEGTALSGPPVSRPPPPSTGPVEVEHIHEDGSPTLLEGPWRAVEIWTANHIYVLDARMVCLEVISRASGKSQADHPIVGARLVGGQKRDDNDAIREVSHPLPDRGANAVFGATMGKRYSLSETSPVTRVVLRQRVVQLGDAQPPEWEALLGGSRPSRA